jgi:hypothetical protein
MINTAAILRCLFFTPTTLTCTRYSLESWTAFQQGRSLRAPSPIAKIVKKIVKSPFRQSHFTVAGREYDSLHHSQWNIFGLATASSDWKATKPVFRGWTLSSSSGDLTQIGELPPKSVFFMIYLPVIAGDETGGLVGGVKYVLVLLGPAFTFIKLILQVIRPGSV